MIKPTGTKPQKEEEIFETVEITETIEQKLQRLKSEAYDLIATKESHIAVANQAQELLNRKNTEIAELQNGNQISLKLPSAWSR